MTDHIMPLEQDVRLLQTQKAEAEITILYLARLSASSSAVAKSSSQVQAEVHPAVQSLEKELERSRKDNEILKAKLENALDVILLLAKSQSQSQSTGNKPRHNVSQGEDKPVVVDPAKQQVNLLDLPNDESSGETLVPTPSLSEESNAESDEGEESLMERAAARTFPPPEYIFRFNGDKQASAMATSSLPNSNSSAVKAPANAAGAKGSNIPMTFSSNSLHKLTGNDSSTDHSSAPSCPNSASTSFSTNLDRALYGEASSPEKRQCTNGNGRGEAVCKMVLDQQGQALAAWNKPHDLQIAEPGPPSENLAQPETIVQANVSESREACTGQIRWKTRPHTFQSPSERNRSLTSHQRLCTDGPEYRFPDFFRYGIRYVPNPEERDVYHTVAISNISKSTSLAEVLDKIYGGMVLSARLVDTSALGRGKTALITFLHEHVASSVVERAENSAFAFRGETAKVTMVQTPTWPMNLPTRKAIFDHKHTRCLEIRNFPSKFSLQSLQHEIQWQWACDLQNLLVRLEYVGEGHVSLQFSDVRYTGYTYSRLQTLRMLADCSIHFVADPCARGSLGAVQDAKNGQVDVELFPQAHPRVEKESQSESIIIMSQELEVLHSHVVDGSSSRQDLSVAAKQVIASEMRKEDERGIGRAETSKATASPGGNAIVGMESKPEKEGKKHVLEAESEAVHEEAVGLAERK